MDIYAIDEAIQTLENGETTIDNVLELASLYIVRDNMFRTGISAKSNDFQAEVNDILPAYEEYRQVKTQFHLNNVPDFVVAKALRLLCKEIEEVIDVLYGSTDMNKERKCIRDLIDKLYNKYNK